MSELSIYSLLQHILYLAEQKDRVLTDEEKKEAVFHIVRKCIRTYKHNRIAVFTYDLPYDEWFEGIIFSDVELVYNHLYDPWEDIILFVLSEGYLGRYQVRLDRIPNWESVCEQRNFLINNL